MVTQEEARKYGIPYYGKPTPKPKPVAPAPITKPEARKHGVPYYHPPPKKAPSSKPHPTLTIREKKLLSGVPVAPESVAEKEEYTPSELAGRLSWEEHKTTRGFEDWKSTIEPTATYQIPTVSDETYRMRRRVDPGYRPGHRIVTGEKLIDEQEKTYQGWKTEQSDIRLDILKSEPGTRFRKTDKGYEARFDVVAWQEQRHKDIGSMSLVTGGVSKFLSGFSNLEYAYSQWTTQPGKQPKRAREIEAMWEYEATKAVEGGDWGKLAKQVVTSPAPLTFVTFGAAKLIGTGIGALKATSIGSKPLLVSRGVWETGKRTGQPLYTITGAKLAEGAIVGYGAYETTTGLGSAFEAGGWTAVKRVVGQMAVMMPFAMVGYKSGHAYGMGYVQRKAAMSKVTDPLSRTRQAGVFESMKRGMKLKEPRFDVSPYDLTRIERIDTRTATNFLRYYKSESPYYLRFGKPRIGGSAAMDIQLPSGAFRTGKLPSSLRQWAISRQLSSGTPRPLIGKQKPGDIDLLIREMFGATKRSSYLRKSHVIDIHGYKPGRYFGYGYAEMPSTKGMIYDFNKIMKVRTLGVKEQFMRKSISILPSETRTLYRAYKDIPDWYDIGNVLSWQKGGGKLDIAMNKVIHPGKYPSPKRGIGEKVIGRIGAVKPDIYIDSGGIGYKYPSYVGAYPKGLGGLAGYAITQYDKKTPPTKYKVPALFRQYGGTPVKQLFNVPYGGIPSVDKMLGVPTKKQSYKGKGYPTTVTSLIPPSQYTQIPYKVKTEFSMPTHKLMKFDIYTEKRKKLDDPSSLWDKKYKFRIHDVGDLSKIADNMTKSINSMISTTKKKRRKK